MFRNYNLCVRFNRSLLRSPQKSRFPRGNQDLCNRAESFSFGNANRRRFCCNTPTQVTASELEEKLRNKMAVKECIVEDTSGNGSFFHIRVSSKEFNDITMLKSHQLVNKILADEIKLVHGISLRTQPYHEPEK